MRAVKAGAVDFLAKPLVLERVETAVLNAVERQRKQLMRLLASIQHGEGDAEGKLKEAPYSLRTAQRLGVACQSLLGRALTYLEEAGVNELSDQENCRDLAQYHLYNAKLIDGLLKSRAGDWAPLGYKPSPMSGYDDHVRELPRRLAGAFGRVEVVPKSFTVEGLGQLKNQGVNPNDQTVDENRLEFDRAEVERSGLTSAAVGEPPVAKQKKGGILWFLKKK